MNTLITEKTADGEVSYNVYSKLIESRVLFLHHYINDAVATDIVATLFYLDGLNDKDKISIYVNSDGGDITSVFMIYDVIKMLNSPVETFCLGTAFGEAALILAAGTKGMRYATKSSVIRLNQLYNGSRHGDLQSAKILLDQFKKENHKFLSALSQCTGKSLKEIEKNTDRDLYLIPTDAKKYGIIDSII